MPHETPLFAHGSPAAPMIVATLELAKQRAHDDAVRRGEAQAVLLVDLHHPEQSTITLGHVHPDGSYEEELLG